jgi:hypothetical protein
MIVRMRKSPERCQYYKSIPQFPIVQRKGSIGTVVPGGFRLSTHKYAIRSNGQVAGCITAGSPVDDHRAFFFNT